MLRCQSIFRFSTIPIKIPAAFCRIWQADPIFHMEMQGAQNSQNNLEEEERSWKTHTSQPQNVVQSYSIQDNAVLA